MILVLALSPSLDITYEIDRLRVGDISRPQRITRVAGGKALNVARAVRALGGTVHAVVALGGHTGEQIADLLAADDVPATVVRISEETRTCIAVVEADGGTSSTDLYEPASPLQADEWAEFARTAERIDADWVVVSGAVPSGVPLEELRALLERFAARGTLPALDSSGSGLRALAEVAALVKVNRSEADEFIGRESNDAADAAAAMQRAIGRDVVVTDGIRDGWAIIDGVGRTVPAPRSRGRFSAGSGDSFLGGLLTGLDDGVHVDAALELARDAGERNAAVPGPAVLAPPLSASDG